MNPSSTIVLYTAQAAMPAVPPGALYLITDQQLILIITNADAHVTALTCPAPAITSTLSPSFKNVFSSALA